MYDDGLRRFSNRSDPSVLIRIHTDEVLEDWCKTMLTTDMHGTFTVLHPAGEIDAATAGEFREALLDALQQASTVAVDFSEVSFMDSSGIAVLAAGVKQTRNHGGRMILVGLPERVRFVLDVTGVSAILDIRPAVADLNMGPG